MQIQTVTKPALRARILDHVDNQLAHQGYRGMRVDDIARDVGISKRTLYELFRTKKDMAVEALSRRHAWLDQELAKLAADSDDACGCLRNIITELCRVHGDRTSALARDLPSTPVLNNLVEDSRSRCNELVDRVLRDGVDRGCFRSDLDVEMTRRTLLVAVEGLASSKRFGDAPGSIEPAVGAVFDVLVGGLQGKPVAAPSVGSSVAQAAC